MKKIILLLVTFQVPSSVFALHALNCSNADRSFVRVEEEIWGANRIYFLIQDKKVEAKKESFIGGTKMMLAKKTGSSPDSGEEIFAAKLLIQYEDNKSKEDYVICRKWWNSQVD